MPLKLILIRHCKSSWDSFAQDDHSRPLNERGKRSAPLIGDWLTKSGHLPKQVLCSNATRTAETWELIAERLSTKPEVSYHKDLYLAPDVMMLEVLRKASGNAVAMVGHNPGIAEFAGMMARAPADHPRFDDYPTGATTVMSFDADRWSEVIEGHGTITDFIIPRDLENT